MDLAGSEGRFVGREIEQPQKNLKSRSISPMLLNTPSPVKTKKSTKNGRQMWKLNKIKTPKNDTESGDFTTPRTSSNGGGSIIGSP